MKDEILFTAKDPNGYKVSLSAERYNHYYVERGHTEVSPQNIKETLTEPNYIFKETKPNSRAYIAKGKSSFPEKYTYVSVAEYDDEGDVRTAYIRPDIGGQIVPIEEGGCLYANFSNKL